MGNCLSFLGLDPHPLPATSLLSWIPSPKRPSPTSSFTPILPFSTPSDLNALYSLGPQLGRGQFGIICRCTQRSSGTVFACKSIPKSHLYNINDIKDVVCEVSIMKHLSNQTPPHGCPPGTIVRLHEVVEDAYFVHLIMELCNGGDLFDRIVKKHRYPEAQAALLMKSLLETLQFCHSMGIIHRDLKPENILLVDESDTSDIKLADFGLALQFSPGQKFSDIAGSAYYVAPEVLQGKYSQEIDLWSTGVIMYVLLSGTPPFLGLTEKGIFKAIKKGHVNFTSHPWHTISSQAKDLITHLICLDVNSRWTPEQALTHPWIIHHTTAKQMSEAPISSMEAQLKSETSVSPAASQHAEHEIECQTSPMTPTAVINLTESNMIESRKSRPELDMLLAALVSSLHKNTVSQSESLAKMKLPERVDMHISHCKPHRGDFAGRYGCAELSDCV